MIVEPEKRIPDFVKAGCDFITIHAEQAATIHLHRALNQVGFGSKLVCTVLALQYPLSCVC